jgi:hypothetical protein
MLHFSDKSELKQLLCCSLVCSYIQLQHCQCHVVLHERKCYSSHDRSLPFKHHTKKWIILVYVKMLMLLISTLGQIFGYINVLFSAWNRFQFIHSTDSKGLSYITVSFE